MNGRQFAIDPYLVVELNQQLRRASQRDHEPVVAPLRRPDVSFLIEAIERAATSLSHKDDDIRRLEEKQRQSEDLIERMKAKLGELLRLQRSEESKAKSEAERADRAEAETRRHRARIQDLESDLEAAVRDMQHIADVIAGSFLGSRKSAMDN